MSKKWSIPEFDKKLEEAWEIMKNLREIIAMLYGKLLMAQTEIARLEKFIKKHNLILPQKTK